MAMASANHSQPRGGQPICNEPKVFMGQVPPEATADQVQALMSRYGTILKTTVITTPDGRSKGCVMVLFSKFSEAEMAIEHENGTTNLGGTKALVVRFADPPKRGDAAGPVVGIAPKKLFVGQIPSSVTEDILRTLFAPHGNIVELHVLQKPAGAGCAFVTFERWSQAEAAIEAINGRTQLDGAKAAIVVKFADAKTPGGQMLGMGGGGGGGGGFQDMPGGMKRSFGGSPEYMPNKKTSQGMGMVGGMGGYNNNNNNRMGGGYDNGMGYGMMGGMGGNMGMGGGMMQMGGGGMGGGGGGRALGMNMATGGGNVGRNSIPANDAAKEWKLFVGQVPFEATEMDLWPVFAQAGNILELVVLRAQGKSKGCAFVTYETKALADRAIRTLDGQASLPNDMRGKPLVVKFANPSAALRAAAAEPEADNIQGADGGSMPDNHLALGGDMNGGGMFPGMNAGMHSGVNAGMNGGMNAGMNGGMNSGMNAGMNAGMNGGGSNMMMARHQMQLQQQQMMMQAQQMQQMQQQQQQGGMSGYPMGGM
ncbi:MAG: hypothetical protein WDW38_001409 [Sanguina aurantia]